MTATKVFVGSAVAVAFIAGAVAERGARGLLVGSTPSSISTEATPTSARDEPRRNLARVVYPPPPHADFGKPQQPTATQTDASPPRQRVQVLAREFLSEGAGSQALSGIDLNTASLEELNSLAGGGRIGRAIIRGRPYRSVEDLVRRRVLKRATFERIRDQITVQTL